MSKIPIKITIPVKAMREAKLSVGDTLFCSLDYAHRELVYHPTEYIGAFHLRGYKIHQNHDQYGYLLLPESYRKMIKPGEEVSLTVFPESQTITVNPVE